MIRSVARAVENDDGEAGLDPAVIEQDAAALAEHLALALDAGGLGTWRWDISSGRVQWDERLEALFGFAPGEFDGTFDGYTQRLHPDDAPDVLRTVQEAVEGKQPYVVRHRAVWPDGTVRWLEGKGTVMCDEVGAVTGTIGCVADVTAQFLVAEERERSVAAALEAAELERISAERLAFLGQINDVLTSATSPAEVMQGVTRAAVPTLGEWCSIFVLPDDGSAIPRVEFAHADPSMVEYARELQKRFPYDPDASTGVPRVIRTGESEFYREIDEQMIAEADATEEARDVVRSLRLRSAIAVPLEKQGRVIGALQFVNTESSRVYTDQDLALAHAVASRVTSTLENRRLAEHQRVIATTLQESLLPNSLPVVPGADLTVRYWAAGEGTEVGGDFYDAFEVGPDHWAVVIGDVCGTGPRAAALTGLARHTIRAAAWNGASGEQVLQQLNHAVVQSERSTFCTVAYCDLRRVDSGFVLAVTAGGHPLPILRRSDGTDERLGVPGTLIGAFEVSESTTTTTTLGAGDTVVLYTDGVTDLAPPHDLTPEEFQAMAVTAAAQGATADAVAANLRAAIETKLPLAERNDDIALLVIRVTADES